MTGRKVTRRASMRRKSMRSPSVSRSSGSKTPRSVTSEPNASGMNSFNSSIEKLNGEKEPVEETAAVTEVVNDRLSFAQVASPAISSTAFLTSELAAIKLADSKENLVQSNEVEESVSGTEEFVSAAEDSIASPLSVVTNKSTDSLNKLTRIDSKLDLNAEEAVESTSTEELVAVETTVELVAVETTEVLVAVETTEELVAVTLDEPKAATEESKEESGEAAGVAVAESESEPVASEEKKSCPAEKAAKCRCIIS